MSLINATQEEVDKANGVKEEVEVKEEKKKRGNSN